MKLPPSFSIFPVSGKKPLVDWGEYSKRLPTKDEIMKWEQGSTSQPTWGIACGPVSKILVLDDDGGLDVKTHPVPSTWTVKTPRGGRHHYFKWTSELDDKVTTRVGVLPGVDVRGQGGFVCFYGFEKPYFLQALATPPQWLIDLLPNKNGIRNSQIANKSSETANKSQIQELLDGISNGNRNDSFTRIAGSLRARGYSAVDMFNLLVPKAREVGFGEQELKTICESVSRYEPNIRVDESIAQNIDEFLKDQQKVEWLVPGMIAKRSIGFIAGLPETGKTWMMMDLAVQAAKGGGQWLGKYPVEKAKVLFIDQERFKGETQRRFKALVSGMAKQSILTSALYVKSGTTIRLNLQNSFDAFRKELSEMKPDIVIVDSFATFHTAEENSRKDVQAVLERVKELRNEFGCTFLFIHHESKMAFDKEQGDPSIAQMAGSVAIPAAAETVFTVRKHDDGSMVYHTKSTLASTVSPFLVKVVDVDNGIKVEGY